MKKCCTCKQLKPLTEFGKAAKRKDGCQTRCKICAKRHRQSKTNKTQQKKYRQSKKGKLTDRRYGIKRYLHHPEKFRAKAAIVKAVRNKILPPVSQNTCQACFKQAEHYHHYLGYAPEHWLDVIPVCHICHYKIHHLS